jgi:hypothetical protein
LLAFDEIVIAVLQTAFWNAQEGGSIGDIANANQLGSVAKKTLSSVGVVGEMRTRGSKMTATIAAKAKATEDKFDAKGPMRKIPNNSGIGTPGNVRTKRVARGAQSEILKRQQSEANRVVGLQMQDVNDPEARQGDLSSPEIQSETVVHNAPWVAIAEGSA